MKKENTDFIQIVDPNEPKREPLKAIKEYDNDGIHYVEYNDGSVMTSTSTNTDHIYYGDQWKTKKD